MTSGFGVSLIDRSEVEVGDISDCYRDQLLKLLNRYSDSFEKQ